MALAAWNAFTGCDCHLVSPSSCLETITLQRFPLSDQVFRQPWSPKMGNVNQFKPTGLFDLKDELSDTTKSLLCALSLCVKTQWSRLCMSTDRLLCFCIACGHLHPHSIAQMFNGFVLEKVFYFQTCLSPICRFLAYEIVLIYRTFR